MIYSDNEFIKLNRKIKNWEWYTDVNTSHFFIYCLLKANWKDGRFKGIDIKRGSFVSSLEKMKVECGLSVQQIRTSLNKLQSTGEITNKSYTKFRVITVNNYEQYQSCNKQDNRQDNKQVTNNQQTNNKQVTTIEEYIRSKEDEEVKNNKSPYIPLFEMVDEKPYSGLLKEKLKDWLKYKTEKKQGYKQTGFKTLLGKIDKALNENKEDAIIECFDDAMSHNWSGVFFDKLQGKKKQESFTTDDIMQMFKKEGE